MIHNFLHYYKPYKRILYGVVIGSLVAALLDLVFPMLVRQILNEVLPQKTLIDYYMIQVYCLFYIWAITVCSILLITMDI